MAVIKSGASSDTLTIDATSKAARITPYDARGNNRGVKATYRASTGATFTAANGTAPFFAIGGSATKTIIVQRIFYTATKATAAANVVLNLTKNSVAISGGTAAALTQIPIDSTDAAGTATTLNTYTVAPTPGTNLGTIEARRCLTNITGAVATQDIFFDFRNVGESQGVVLRGTAENLNLLYQSAPGHATEVSVWVEWTEE